MQGVQVAPAGGVLLLDGSVQVEHAGAAQQVEAAGHLAATQGRAVRPGRHADAHRLQVELPDEFAHVLVEVREALLHLRLHQVALRAGHSHLSASAPPVQDGQGDADAHGLLLGRVAVDLGEAVGSLRQAETEIEAGLQSGIGLGLRHVALGLHPPALQARDVRAVYAGPLQGLALVDHHVRQLVRHPDVRQRVAVGQSQIGTQVQGALLHRDAGVHAVGLLVQQVDLQLEHLVLRRGPDAVTPLGETVERVRLGIVLAGRAVVALRQNVGEKLVHRRGGHQFQRLEIGAAGLLVAQGIDAAVPLQAVVAEERLAVGHVHRHAFPRERLVAQQVHPLQRGLQGERAARPGDVLLQGKREVGVQVVLLHEAHRPVVHGHLVDGAVQPGVRGERERRQVVRTIGTVVPIGRTESVAGGLRVRRGLAGQGHHVLQPPAPRHSDGLRRQGRSQPQAAPSGHALVDDSIYVHVLHAPFLFQDFFQTSCHKTQPFAYQRLT